MDVVRRGVRCHPCEGSKESKFCQVFLHSSLSLSERNQPIVCCLSLVDRSEIDRKDVKEFFEGRIFESFIFIPDRCQVSFFPLEGFPFSEEGEDECNLCLVQSVYVFVYCCLQKTCQNTNKHKIGALRHEICNSHILRTTHSIILISSATDSPTSAAGPGALISPDFFPLFISKNSASKHMSPSLCRQLLKN